MYTIFLHLDWRWESKLILLLAIPLGQRFEAINVGIKVTKKLLHDLPFLWTGRKLWVGSFCTPGSYTGPCARRQIKAGGTVPWRIQKEVHPSSHPHYITRVVGLLRPRTVRADASTAP